jgi:poly(A) polymerase
VLQASGHEALLAGGCVRDLLLGKSPKDFDVATSARPADILKLFPAGRQVGAHFGVVIVHRLGHPIEVATFRTDGPYSDGRHPDQVTFATAKEDARRRDFTINGMFLDVSSDQVIDYVGGRDDLDARLIQAIGDPERRFDEDHLRMLRAVRIATQLNFTIEQDTFEALYNRAARLRRVSAERTREELERMLCDPRRAAGFQLLADTGLLPHVWPQARWDTARIRQSHAALTALPPPAGFPLALAAALHHHAPGDIDTLCRDLTCSNEQRRHCLWLVRALAPAAAGEVRTLADLKLLMASEFFSDLPALLAAHLTALGRSTEAARDLAERARAVPPELVRPAPWVTGDDLLRLGLKPGPQYKSILDQVYYDQLDLKLPDAAAALELARRLAGGT